MGKINHFNNVDVDKLYQNDFFLVANKNAAKRKVESELENGTVITVIIPSSHLIGSLFQLCNWSSSGFFVSLRNQAHRLFSSFLVLFFQNGSLCTISNEKTFKSHKFIFLKIRVSLMQVHQDSLWTELVGNSIYQGSHRDLACASTVVKDYMPSFSFICFTTWLKLMDFKKLLTKKRK